MVIYNLDLVGIAILPHKANPPLIVNPNTVLALPVTMQLLQSIGRWEHQVLQIFGRMQYCQSAVASFLNIFRKPGGIPALEHPLSLF